MAKNSSKNKKSQRAWIIYNKTTENAKVTTSYAKMLHYKQSKNHRIESFETQAQADQAFNAYIKRPNKKILLPIGVHHFQDCKLDQYDRVFYTDGSIGQLTDNQGFHQGYGFLVDEKTYKECRIYTEPVQKRDSYNAEYQAILKVFDYITTHADPSEKLLIVCDSLRLIKALDHTKKGRTKQSKTTPFKTFPLIELAWIRSHHKHTKGSGNEQIDDLVRNAAWSIIHTEKDLQRKLKKKGT